MRRHRAITSTGAVVDDPSAGALAELLAEVDRSGRDAFVVVERHVGREPGQHRARAGVSYLQARRDRAGWVLDLQDGGPSRHVRAVADGLATVQSVLAAWVAWGRAWPDPAWPLLGAAPAEAAPGLVAAG